MFRRVGIAFARRNFAIPALKIAISDWKRSFSSSEVQRLFEFGKTIANTSFIEVQS